MDEEFFDLSSPNLMKFSNNATKCIGTGRLGLALRHEYLEQLAYIQKNIGFEFIRGHGLFSEDIGIYQEYTDSSGNTRVEYNFTYLDQIMDSYQRLGLKPFIELGFMPQKLGSGSDSVFYWHGNITPPASETRWTKLVQATLSHLKERYGEKVTGWPIEVWNEPNIDQFWKNADMDAYFRLFQITFQAIKKVDLNFKVGGPAICGVDDERWLRKFIEFCEKQDLKLDFITRHFYTVTSSKIEGHYRYPKLRNVDESLKELEVSRKIIDNSPKFSSLPMYITEFNTSYSPDAPLHDTVKNAVYMAYLLSKLGDTSDIYSYWTFGDVFEEKGIPFSQFYGGFGLVATHNIPKPTFWTFKFFDTLGSKYLLKTQSIIVTKQNDGSLAGIVWNLDSESKRYQLKLSQKFKKSTVVTQTIDESNGNPLRIWHALGEPSSLDASKTQLLRRSAVPAVGAESVRDGKVSVEIMPNSLIQFKIQPTINDSDRGFDYERLV